MMRETLFFALPLALAVVLLGLTVVHGLAGNLLSAAAGYVGAVTMAGVAAHSHTEEQV